MSIFQDALNDSSALEAKMLGPSYPYYKNIKTPAELGMSDKGTIQQMSKDVDGLVNYVELLVTGKSKASATGQPLGNKFFLQTGAKCSAMDQCTDPKDPSTCAKVDRFIYVDNVPEGNIPFISSGMGVNFTEFRGLIPGAMSDLNVLNPMGLMRGFMMGANPPCQPMTLTTINNENVRSSETHYLALADIQNMDPCSFPNGVNPVTKQKCRETFVMPNHEARKKYWEQRNKKHRSQMREDGVTQIYLGALTLLSLYIVYSLSKKG